MRALLRPATSFRAAAPLALLVLSAPLGGCPTDDDDDDTPMPGFCVTVAGGGVYDSIQDAIDAASAGATINICDGTYEEDVDINKAVNLVGQSQEGVIITGGEAGTVLEIDRVDAPVTLSRLTLYSPADNPGTIRGMRITDSAEVLINEVHIEFEPNDEGEGRGLVGIEISRSAVTINDLTTFFIGFGSETGGTAILAQTGSTVEVIGSSIVGSGAFGIHAVSSDLAVRDSEIRSTNRPSGAEQFDADGSGIYVESGPDEVILENVVVDSGSFVGAWLETNDITVTGSSFSNFAYGIYHPGDAASSAGRQTVVQASDFQDLANEALLSFASTSISGSTFSNTAVGTRNSGIRVVAPGGDISVSGSILENMGQWGLQLGGSTADGPAAGIEVVGNTVQTVTRGNGIMILDTETAVITDNVVVDVDHEYYQDPENPQNNGQILNGYGIACFRVDDCALSGNDVEAAEFSNFVIVGSNFTSTEDVSRGFLYEGLHVQESQGTVDRTQFLDGFGNGAFFSESNILVTGVTMTNLQLGPHFTEIDGFQDPKEVLFDGGGWGVNSLSGGSPGWMRLEGSTFTDVAYGGVLSQFAAAEIEGNTFVNVGQGTEEAPFTQGAIYIFGGEENAVRGPEVIGNVIGGNDGSYGVSVYQVDAPEIRGNEICGGSSGGLLVSGADGSEIRNNLIGAVSDGESAAAAACGELAWQYGLRVSYNGVLDEYAGTLIEGNTIAGTAVQGIAIGGLGPYTIEDNTITAGSSSGISATLSPPTSVFTDEDGDSASEWSGDCDDTNALVGGNNQAEVPGDGFDNDCDGVVDDGLSTTDADGDGWTQGDGDCDDADPTVNPGAEEIFGNSYDDDCNGEADVDAGFPAPDLTLIANVIEGPGVGTGIDFRGNLLVLQDDGATGNRIEGVAGAGISLGNGTYGAQYSTASAELGLATEIIDVGTHCLELAGEGTSLLAGASTFTGCGDMGLRSVAVGASAVLTGTTFDGPLGHGVFALAGTVLLDSVIVTGPGGNGLHAQGGTIDAVDTAVTAAGGNAAHCAGGVLDIDGGTYASGSDAALRTTFGQTSVLDSAFTSAAADGASVAGGTVELTGTDVTGEEDGLVVTGGAATFSGGAITANTGDGVYISTGSLTLVNGSVAAPGGAGLNADGGTLSVSGTLIDGASADGISLSGALNATITGPTLSNNGGYGLSCAGAAVTLNACTAEVSGNASGAFSLTGGCESNSCTAL